MASPIKIRADADFSELLKAAKNAGKSLDDLITDFDAVQDASKDAATSAERGFDKVGRSARDAGKDIDKAGRDGFHKAGEASGEFKDEAISNLSEITSSFSGDFSDIGELAQGTFGGLAGLGGGLGAVGAAGAAAIGVVTAAFEDAKAATDEARESAYEYGITVGAAGKYADVAARINDLTGSVEGLKKVQDIATISGWEQVDVVKALATGDGLPALTKAFEDGANNTTIASKRTLELEGALTGAADGFRLAADASSVNARALYDLATQAGVATGEVDDLGNQIIEMPGGKTVVVDAETQTAYEDLNAIENKQFSPKTVAVRFQPDLAAWNQLTLPTKYVQVQAQMASNLSPDGPLGRKQS